MKRNRHFKTIVCLALGAVLLTGSVFANYDNASGYTRLKNGLINLTTVENLSAEASSSVAVNGENVSSTSGLMKYDANGDVSEYRLSEDSTDDSKYETWIQNGFRIKQYTNADGVPSYDVYVAEEKGFNYEYINSSEDEKNVRQKELDFFELFADTLIGDLKNNFVLVSSENGVSEYEIDLSRNQIPELIKSGLSLMALPYYSLSYDGRTYYEDYDVMNKMSDEDSDAISQEIENHFVENDDTGVAYVKVDGSIVYYDTYEDYVVVHGYPYEMDSMSEFFDNMAGDLVLENAKCNASVDSDGNINFISASVDFSATGKNGKKQQTLTMSGEAKFYDCNNTIIEDFDQSILSLDWENAKNSNCDYYDFDRNGKLIQYDVTGVEVDYIYEEGADTEGAIVEDDASADDAA